MKSLGLRINAFSTPVSLCLLAESVEMWGGQVGTAGRFEDQSCLPIDSLALIHQAQSVGQWVERLAKNPELLANTLQLAGGL